MADVPPQVQNQIKQYQQTQQQLQSLMAQKQQMDGKVRELERTVSALDEIDEKTPVYRSVGSVLVGVDDPEALRADLADEKETLEVRLKSVERQESGLRDRIETLQNTLENLLGQGAGGPA